MLDDNELQLDITKLSKEELLFAIMRFSALPGCSRHHWGTDIDIYDSNGMPPGYQVNLTHSECIEDGPFASFHNWLDEAVAAGETSGFTRPYDKDVGTVAQEKWHLSYSPVSKELRALYTKEIFRKNLEGADILLCELLLNNEALFNRIYNDYLI